MSFTVTATGLFEGFVHCCRSLVSFPDLIINPNIRYPVGRVSSGGVPAVPPTGAATIMSVRLEEEDLANIKIHVLILKRNELVENVDPRRYLTFLRSKYVIDERDCDEIKEVRSRQASAEVFLDILRRKGSTGYDEFCNALAYDKTQVFLLTAMTKTLELLKAKVLDNKAKGITRTRV